MLGHPPANLQNKGGNLLSRLEIGNFASCSYSSSPHDHDSGEQQKKKPQNPSGGGSGAGHPSQVRIWAEILEAEAGHEASLVQTCTGLFLITPDLSAIIISLIIVSLIIVSLIIISLIIFISFFNYYFIF